jgi:hypothetical protein
MSDNEDPLLAIIVGAVFGAVIIILGFRFLIVRCDKTKKNNSSTVKVIPSKSLSTPVVPQKIKLRRKVTHDPNNTEPRKIIERIRIGIELIFKEFDQSRDGLIDTQEVRKSNNIPPKKNSEGSGGPERLRKHHKTLQRRAPFQKDCGHCCFSYVFLFSMFFPIPIHFFFPSF